MADPIKIDTLIAKPQAERSAPIVYRIDPIVDAAVVKLRESEQSIVKDSFPSKRFPLIGEMGPDELVSFAQQLRKDVVLRLGLNINNSSAEEEFKIIAEIGKTIWKYKGMTKKEIQNAVDRALDGEYLASGQTTVFFSITNLSIWIKIYLNAVRAPVMKKYLQFKYQVEEENRPELNRDEAFEMRVRTVNGFLEQRKIKPSHRIFGRSLFDGLEESGITFLNEEDRNEYLKIARVENPKGSPDIWEITIRAIAYNNFISDLLDFGLRLGPDGKPVEDPNPYIENTEAG